LTEARIEKLEKIDDIKKKLQKVAYNMWSKALRGYDKLYVVASFDLKTVEEDLAPQFQRKDATKEDKATNKSTLIVKEFE
jgi:hypothetical protein